MHRKVLKMGILLSLLAHLSCTTDQVEMQSAGFTSWAATPPMGWNSWDCYGPTVTEAEVKANADYMAEHLLSYGWQYIVVDIRWYVENTKSRGYNQTDPRFVMDEYGRFLPAVNRFPSAEGGKGFKPLSDYVHGKGLKFGVHMMRGIPVVAVKNDTPILGSAATASQIYSEDLQCKWLRDMYTIDATKDGAQSYYDSIFKQYAEWGVDYVKVDNISRPYHTAEIEMIRKAIDKCGRPIVLSLSPGATPVDQASHVVQHANLWRISDDFWDRWQDIEEQFARCKAWAPHIGDGTWPDADMLPLGRIGIRAERGDERRTRLTQDEQVTLMTLWAIFRSPLMFGGDLPSNDAFTLALITNPEVLAVNQNSNGNREFFNRAGHIGWIADAPDAPDKYIALFSTNDADSASSPITDKVVLQFDEAGLTGTYTIRDLWAQKNLGSFENSFTSDIAFHGAGLYRVSPATDNSGIH